jgi:hypothetical protein
MSFLLNGLAASVLTAHSPAPQLRQPAPFSPDALRLAVVTTMNEPQAGGQADWTRVTQLGVNDEVTVLVAGQPPISGRVASVDQSALTLRLASGSTSRFERATIQEVRLSTKRRGSKLGAVIGAGAAGFAGAVIAIGLATKECGASCTDEKVGIGLSLIALPVGGGFAGYYLFPGKTRVEVIYTRPML